jgi:hypothetical protein
VTDAPIRSGLDLVGRHEREFPTGPQRERLTICIDLAAGGLLRDYDRVGRAAARFADSLRRLKGEGA